MSDLAPEFQEKCRAAMAKPAPVDALKLLASGRVTVEVRGTDIYLDTIDGRMIRSTPSGRISRVGKGYKMGIAGAWPLIGAGMVDADGNVTDAGRAALKDQQQ